jgi:hypothetical protein
MSDIPITIISDNTSLRMPVLAGEITLYRDGTYGTRGPVAVDDVIALFRALESPAGGRVWWKIFALSEIYKIDEMGARRAYEALGMHPNEWSIIKSPNMARWLSETGLFRKLSVTVFVDSKAKIWDSDLDRPRTDRIAKLLVKHFLRCETNPSREDVKKLAQS